MVGKNTPYERGAKPSSFFSPRHSLNQIVADGELRNKETSLRERFGNLKITDLKGTTDTVRTLCECLPRRHCCCCCCSCRGASCLWRWQRRSLRSNTSAEERESHTIYWHGDAGEQQWQGQKRGTGQHWWQKHQQYSSSTGCIIAALTKKNNNIDDNPRLLSGSISWVKISAALATL